MRTLLFFYRQLAQLVGSGVTIVEAIDLIARQEGNARMKNAAARIKEHLAAGNSLADSCARFPEIFPQLHINIIRYSEKAGRIADGLKSLAECQEKAYALRQSLIVGLAYPVVLLHGAMVLLPVVNAAFGGPSAYVRGFLAIFLPVYGLCGLLYFLYRMQRHERFKAQADAFVLSMPLFGGFLRSVCLTGFIRALQTLCDSGVPILTGWRLAADACGNSSVSAALLAGLSELEQGSTLARAFSTAGLFPAETVAMVSAAEKSGSIVQTLHTVAAYAEQKSQDQIALMNRVLPMVFYFLVAGFVALRIISFYAGYYSRVFSITP